MTEVGRREQAGAFRGPGFFVVRPATALHLNMIEEAGKFQSQVIMNIFPNRDPEMQGFA